MASRTSIIACGVRLAVLAMAMKFIAGPALMAVASLAITVRGTVFKVAIVQVKSYIYFFPENVKNIFVEQYFWP